MKNNALHELDGKVSLIKILPFSLQQILAMFVTNVVPIGIVVAAANPVLSQYCHEQKVSCHIYYTGNSNRYKRSL